MVPLETLTVFPSQVAHWENLRALLFLLVTSASLLRSRLLQILVLGTHQSGFEEALRRDDM